MTQCQRSDSLKPFLNVGKVDLMRKRVVFGDKRTEKKNLALQFAFALQIILWSSSSSFHLNLILKASRCLGLENKIHPYDRPSPLQQADQASN